MKIQLEYFEPTFEQMTREDMRELSLTKFKIELKNACQENDFYKEKFKEVRPEQIRTFDDIKNIPVTTKEDMLKDVENYPPYGSRLQVPANEISCVIETSGTSGKGKETHALTARDYTQIVRAEKYGFFWTGVRRGTVTFLFFPITMTAASTWWFRALVELESNLIRAGHLSTAEKLKYMQRYRAEFIPSAQPYLERMEYVASEIGMDLKRDIPSLKSILIFSSSRAEYIEKTEAKWGAKIYEQYGCSQRGIGFTCEYGRLHKGNAGMIHMLNHFCLTEVIDRSTGKHVQPGEEGEIVLTPFKSEAMPLIRFATNDKAVFLASDYCSCGRPFDGLKCGSISRYDDMMKIKGINIWPEAVDQIVLGRPEIYEYKGDLYVDEKGNEIAEIHLEFRRGVSNKERIADEVSKSLREELKLGFVVKEWTAPTPLFSIIARKNTGKAKRWADRRIEAKGERL
jgi:phenylacetate-CoA ligase